MHFLAVSLLAILAGTLLLAKTKKEELGKFFTYISWFFVVVGFILFVGFIAGGICKMSHCGKQCNTECSHGMMMKDCKGGGHDGMSCPPGMCKGSCEDMSKCMKDDSLKECCPGHKECDSTKMPVPKKE
jgi:hypothetical protein